MAEIVVFLGMGGTIAGTAAQAGDNVGYTAAQVGVEALLESVPGLQHILGQRQLQSEQVCQLDSKDMDFAHWCLLRTRLQHYLAKPDVSGVVVMHGTDTVEEAAYFLSSTLAAELQAQKPVVLTCAMRPASSLAPDGPTNMADAAAVAVHKGARGVLVVCAGKIHSAAHVQKIHPYRVDAFDSGEAGPVGLVEEGRLRLLADFPHVSATPAQNASVWQRSYWPRVELLLSYAGAGGALVRAMLATHDPRNPLRGIVVAGTGNGTIHKDMEVALAEAQAQGVRVVRVSRCAYGQVVEACGAGHAGTIASYGLSAVKARIALMLELAAEP